MLLTEHHRAATLSGDPSGDPIGSLRTFDQLPLRHRQAARAVARFYTSLPPEDVRRFMAQRAAEVAQRRAHMAPWPPHRRLQPSQTATST